MPLASITDLPNELLAHIFGEPTLPDESLYFLALLCRRLHLIALSIYFSRHGINLEKGSAFITLDRDRLDPLPGLQICTFIPAMEHVSCIFPRQSWVITRPFIRQIKRLHAFFSRLYSVETVVLDLDSFMHPYSWSSLLGTGEELREWVREYGALLSCIVQRGCRSLTVINGGVMREKYQISLGFTMRRVMALAIARLFSLNGFRVHVSARSGLRLLPLQSSDHASRLTSLHLQSATLLTPSRIAWTLSVLHQSPITSLTIFMSRILAGRQMWRRFLTLVASAAPYLTTLLLLHVDPWFMKHALGFVARLHKLIHLILDFPPNLIPLQPTCRFTCSLKHLVTLRAPLIIVDRLLASGGSLPLIRTLALVWNAPTDSNITTLTHPLSSIAATLRKRNLSPRISLSLPIARLRFVLAHASAQTFLPVHDIYLTATEAPLHFEEALCERVARFVSLFPSATYVAITTDGDVPIEHILTLAHGVRAAGWLNVMEVNGVRYDLSRPS